MNKIEYAATTIVLPAVIGALLAGSVVAGVVTVATAPPDVNPATREILVYGR